MTKAKQRAPAKKGAAPKRRALAPAASADVTLDTVTVGKHEVRLGTPSSMSVVYDVIQGTDTNKMRGLAAALGLCWEAGSTLHAPAKYRDFKYDTLAYGGAVLDALAVRKVPLVQIVHAGQIAFLRLTSKLPSAEDVDDTEAFTAPGRDA